MDASERGRIDAVTRITAPLFGWPKTTAPKAESAQSARILEIAQRVGLIGDSWGHRGLLAALFKAGQIDAEVMLIGETGVGKELYARFVHRSSPRANNEFVAVNCGAIPDALFENEMFGHSAGAYTDAGPRSDGLVSAAEGGTLFLDEVDSLPPTAQVKLLRLLQEKEYRRLGETRLRRANIRIISAMNADPTRAITERRLREDLFYRLNVITQWIPPLRERAEDVVVLANAFVRRYWKLYRNSAEDVELAPRFSADAESALCEYEWPGNVRQLENMIRSLVCQQSEFLIRRDAIPLPDRPVVAERSPDWELDSLLTLPFCEAKQQIVDRFENAYLRKMLLRSGGNICLAAQYAGKHRRAFFELMRKHGIGAEEFRTPELPSLKRLNLPSRVDTLDLADDVQTEAT